MKETRGQRDNYKKKFDECLTLQGGTKDELLNMLKNSFERLILEIVLTPKIKEFLTVILKLLDYSEDEIAQIWVYKDEKKKNFFGFFK